MNIRIIIDNGILKDKIRDSEILFSNLADEHKKEFIDEAMELARAQDAKGLPGYLGPN